MDIIMNNDIETFTIYKKIYSMDESKSMQDDGQVSEPSANDETKKKRNYDNEVFVSKPSLSSKSSLQLNTLELR